MNIFKEVYTFFTETKYERIKTVNYRVIDKIKEFLVFDFFTLLLGSLLILTTFFFDDFRGVYFTKNSYFDTSFLNTFIKLCLLAPLVEELAFRVGLRITKLNTSLYFGFFTVVFLKFIGLIELNIALSIGIALLLSLLFFLLLNDKILSVLKKHYYKFLVFNLCCFSFAHLGSFSFSTVSQYLFIPVLVFIQFCLGAYLSYSRLKYGFLFTLFLHFIHNSFFTVLSHLIDI